MPEIPAVGPGQEVQEFKASLSRATSLRTAWATRDLASNTKDFPVNMNDNFKVFEA